jgi:glycine/D-amino acid oxidase-like deaminating enzyme
LSFDRHEADMESDACVVIVGGGIMGVGLLFHLASEGWTDSDCAGNEPVYAADRLVGLTTSGAFGHAVGKSLAFAYVPPSCLLPVTRSTS